MADITYTSKATERRASPGAVVGKGDANNLRVLGVGDIILGAVASGTTHKVCTIPTNARLSTRSRLYWEALTTTGSATLDVGLGSVNSNITSDPDALTADLSATITVAGAPLLLDITDGGKPAWEIAGASSDPGGALDVYVSVKDAATAGVTTGHIVCEVLGYLD